MADLTNERCPFFKDGQCRKQKKRCNNKARFYPECNVYRGNKTLSTFLRS